MRALLLISFLLLSTTILGQNKYPIQTIFKGDSVVVLSIKQSMDINKALETQKRIIREQARKITALNKTIDSLNKTIANIPNMLDSIQYVADTTYKWADDLNMTLW
jgi:septal ring factor EnvC (AmiA/AmiB activator)